MNEEKFEKSPLVKLDNKFLEFINQSTTTTNNQKKSHSQNLKDFYQQEVKGSKDYKIKYRTKDNRKVLNVMYIDGVKYQILHAFNDPNQPKAPRTKRYSSGSFASTKTAKPLDGSKKNLKIKVFHNKADSTNKIKNRNRIFCNDAEQLKRIIFEARVHRKLKRKSQVYMRYTGTYDAPFKFYLIMKDLGQMDLLSSINKENRKLNNFYKDTDTLCTRIQLAIQILTQVETLFEENLRWIDAKPENIIIKYDENGQPKQASITDFDSASDETNLNEIAYGYKNITYIPKNICGKTKVTLKNLQNFLRHERYADRVFVISTLSFSIATLFPDFIKCQVKNRKIAQPELTRFEWLIGNQEAAIYEIILNMYNKGNEWTGEIKETYNTNLKPYIEALQKILNNQNNSNDAQENLNWKIIGLVFLGMLGITGIGSGIGIYCTNHDHIGLGAALGMLGIILLLAAIGGYRAIKQDHKIDQETNEIKEENQSLLLK